MRRKAAQDDLLLAEMYEQLLLETPATEANIERFLKKYFSREIAIGLETKRENHKPPIGPGGPFDEKAALKRVKVSYIPVTIRTLKQWTPGVQQVIKNNGGNPDIFGYPDYNAVKAAIEAAVSKTSQKKSYKLSDTKNIPLILETSLFNAYLPKTWEASRKYFGVQRISLLDGEQKEGSNWCTASSDAKFFEKFVNEENNRLIYYIRKSDDVLFAYRGQGIGPSGEWLENQFKNFIWMLQDRYVYDNIKAWRMLPENHPNKLFFYSQAWNSIRVVVQYSSNLIYEIRDQSNKRINSLEEFYIELHNITQQFDLVKHAEEYLKFIAFTVYGQTELTGYGQIQSDEELKRISVINAPEEED